MIEKILKDRLTSMELYQGKLKKDRKKLNHFKKAENEIVAKKAVELDNSMGEVLDFIESYKKELVAFLENTPLTMKNYQEKFTRYDDKFMEVLKFIQKKEDEFRTLES